MIYSHNFTNMQVSAFQRAKNNNEYNGDSYIVIETDKYFVCGIADGLGSGELAKDSSEAAILAIKQAHHLSVEEMLRAANESLYGMRGVVMAVFKIDYEAMELSFSGIGNINLMLFYRDGKVVRPVTYSGYLSGKPQKYRVERLSIETPIFFFMHSDGFNGRMNNREIIYKMKSPEHAVYNIKESLTELNDDITCLVGQMYESS